MLMIDNTARLFLFQNRNGSTEITAYEHAVDLAIDLMFQCHQESGYDLESLQEFLGLMKAAAGRELEALKDSEGFKCSICLETVSNVADVDGRPICDDCFVTWQVNERLNDEF